MGIIGAIEQRRNDDEVHIKLSGKYEFIVTQQNLSSMEENRQLIVSWAFDDRMLKNTPKYMLSSELVIMLLKKLNPLRLEQLSSDTQRQKLQPPLEVELHFMHIRAFRVMNGTIGL